MIRCFPVVLSWMSLRWPGMVAEVQTSLPPLDMTPILYPSEMIFPDCLSLSGGVTKMARGTWRQVLQTV